MSDRSETMAQLLDDALIDALKHGVGTGEFSQDGVEQIRKAGPVEWKIVKDRLKDMGVGSEDPLSSAINFNERLKLSGKLPDLSMDDDPAS